MLCDSMKWSHLPQAGGIYNQNPDLIDRFYYLFAERNKAEERRQKQDERRSAAGAGRTKVAGRRR